jgi:hypothetical protein
MEVSGPLHPTATLSLEEETPVTIVWDSANLNALEKRKICVCRELNHDPSVV